MKCKAWQAELWGDTQHEPNVFAHIKPLLLQGHHPQEPSRPRAYRGGWCCVFRATAGLSEAEKKKRLPCKQTKLDFIAFKVQLAQTVAKVQTLIKLRTF